MVCTAVVQAASLVFGACTSESSERPAGVYALARRFGLRVTRGMNGGQPLDEFPGYDGAMDELERPMNQAADFGLDPAFAQLLLLGAIGAVVLFALFIFVLGRFLIICRPNEIVVISGRGHTLADGSSVGFKLLHGGRGFRIPVLEMVSRMDTRLIPVGVEVQNAYSKGGIPLEVHAVANVKIATEPRLLRNAVERLLDTKPAEVASIAQQTLEGVLREVVAELTPEEVNEDRLKFAETLMRNAKDDFDKLGLELDVLKIQSVSDQQKYLANLGRARIAGMVRDAENAENAANQAIAEAAAKARQRAESAKKQAEALVLTKHNELRAELARLDGEARSVENEAAVAAQTAKAEAEQELQALRSELEKLRLEVEVYLPAEAQRLASEAEARAQAAPVVESGKAAAEALRVVAEQWRAAGRDGRDLYVLQHLRAFVEAAVHRVRQAKIREFNVVDGGDGTSLSGALASFPAAVAEVLEETGRVIGVDMRALLDGKGKEGRP